MGGPLGAALSARQKGALKEALEEIHAGGVRYSAESAFASLSGDRREELEPGEVLRRILKGGPEFDAGFWMKRGNETEEFRTLGDLAAIDAFYGSGDPGVLEDPEAARALLGLGQAGWEIRVPRKPGSWRTRAAGALAAYRHLVKGVGPGLTLVAPDGTSYEDIGRDELGPLSYFYASGDLTALRHPALAGKIREIMAGGLELVPVDRELRRPGSLGGYLALERGGAAELRVADGGPVLGKVRGTGVSPIDRLVAGAGELLELHRTVLLPEVRAKRLAAHQAGHALATVARPIPGVPLRERAERFLEIVRAVRCGPDGRRKLGEQTSAAVKIYDQLREYGLEGERFRKGVSLAAGLLEVTGADTTQQALRYLYQQLPQVHLVPEARQQRARLFLRLLRASGSVAQAVQGVDMALIQLGRESLEERMEVLESLARAGRLQQGYHGLCRDYQTLLSARLPGQTLQQAARVYTTLLEGLARVGHADEAWQTYIAIEEGVRFGHLMSPPQVLADRFLDLLVFAKDPGEARRRLLQSPDEKGIGTIEEGEHHVRVGHVELPRWPDPGG